VPLLKIIAGPNGSGKSSLTKTLDGESIVNLLDPDAIARRLDPVDPRRAALTAGRETIRRTQEYLEARISFAIETTLASKKTAETMREAKSRGFFVDFIYVCLDAPERNIMRVKERASRGGHDVSDEDVRRRYFRSLSNLPEAIQSADLATLFDNSENGRHRALEFREGSVTWRADVLPKWVIRALPHLNP